MPDRARGVASFGAWGLVQAEATEDPMQMDEGSL